MGKGLFYFGKQWLVILISCLGMLPRAGAQPSSQPLDQFWRVDGPVHAIAVTGDTAYVGGAFSYVGPVTGAAGGIDLATADATGWNPDASNLIRTPAASDETLFAGGDFTTVSGRPHSYFAAFSRAPAFNPASLKHTADGQFQYQCSSGDGFQLTIQSSSNLIDWTNVRTFDETGSLIEFIDAESPTFPQRFYRLALTSSATNLP